MKGKLIKIEERWMVGTVCYADLWSNYMPLHPDDVKQIEEDAKVFDNIEARIAAYPDVEFDVVSEWENGEVGVNGLIYAKLTSFKESQKQLITEIMNLDAKDGLYEDDVWKVGLEDELNKLPYTKHLDDGQYNDGQLVGFELGATWGYNKAKETLYTEEQMVQAVKFFITYKAITDRDVWDKDIYLYIQSLKQPKKD